MRERVPESLIFTFCEMNVLNVLILDKKNWLGVYLNDLFVWLNGRLDLWTKMSVRLSPNVTAKDGGWMWCTTWCLGKGGLVWFWFGWDLERERERRDVKSFMMKGCSVLYDGMMKTFDRYLIPKYRSVVCQNRQQHLHEFKSRIILVQGQPTLLLQL